MYKRERDESRAQRVYREYDHGRRYGDYHAHCQARFKRELESAPGTALQQRGFEYFTPLDETEAGGWRRELQENYSSGLIKKNSKHLEGFHVTDAVRVEELLVQVLAGSLDQRIMEYFNSEYLLHWVTFSVTRQAREQESVSFRWHCDKGPSTHLKLIVYLNPSAEHGGNTEFIDLEGSEAVARQRLSVWLVEIAQFGHSASVTHRRACSSRTQASPLAGWPGSVVPAGTGAASRSQPGSRRSAGHDFVHSAQSGPLENCMAKRHFIRSCG